MQKFIGERMIEKISFKSQDLLASVIVQQKTCERYVASKLFFVFEGKCSLKYCLHSLFCTTFMVRIHCLSICTMLLEVGFVFTFLPLQHS